MRPEREAHRPPPSEPRLTTHCPPSTPARAALYTVTNSLFERLTVSSTPPCRMSHSEHFQWPLSGTQQCLLYCVTPSISLLFIIIIIIIIQPLGRFGKRPEFSQSTGIALVLCILSKFLGVVCHCFPPRLDVPTFHHQVSPRPSQRERS